MANIVVEVKVTVAGVKAPQVRPAGTVSVRVTAPMNPLILARGMMVGPGRPTGTVTAVLKTLKSTTLTVTITEWDSGPLVPVMLTVKVPTVVEFTVMVEL